MTFRQKFALGNRRWLDRWVAEELREQGVALVVEEGVGVVEFVMSGGPGRELAASPEVVERLEGIHSVGFVGVLEVNGPQYLSLAWNHTSAAGIVALDRPVLQLSGLGE